MEHFSMENSNFINFSRVCENLKKQTKPKIVENLKTALTALQLAVSYMKKHSDTILKSKQIEQTRKLIENKKIDSPLKPHQKL